jgi:hypothetical protein
MGVGELEGLEGGAGLGLLALWAAQLGRGIGLDRVGL